ncbi:MULTISPECIES: heme-binding protein [unclassified Beijerinckia]|uniref:GlcG/HbpS family heme-binding protein n=1 Tax=unclassified Beijerinckia TaxID=2638183 RepID=UPI000899982C|nr:MULTISPECIES: heme-binding protein [unclassified Beijerinckia]MDH7799323.1 uncharacterized protein GlcG (DUF336 family) [Beijerinckia sp. GAS462]SED46234.1 Uncharacterized conserved protein GlcG, DUF336 family [Beijerinckia sp. 28-YEA-48]
MIDTKLMRRTAAFAGLLFAAAVCPVQAQTQDVLVTHRLSAALANEIAAEAVASCARQGYAETAVVVDANGTQQALLRGDRAGVHTLDSAYHKAYTAATFKNDTTKLAEQVKKSPEFAALFTLPHLLPAGGGVVIKIGDEVIGAVGAGGAPGFNLDEGCAKAGIDKVRDRLK